MARPDTGRRVLLILVLVCLAAALPAAAQQQPPAPPAGAPERPSRLDRAERWATALERHDPGVADEALNEFGAWRADDLSELTITISSVLALMREPKTRIFMFQRSSRGISRSFQVLYSGAELRRLQALAVRLAALGEAFMLKRAALLHMDVVVLGSGADSQGGQGRRTDYVLLRFSDGQERSMEDATGHWDTARFMLDQVWTDKRRDFRPNPSRDDWVRRWYRTAIAHMLARMQFHPTIFNRGVELFPSDGEILFLAGALHETLASPAVQEPLRTADVPRNISFGIGSARAELDEAEDLLRRALKSQVTIPEMHLRLGHVLAELGRHKDAVGELRQAVAAEQPSALLYFGELFLGRSEGALGNGAAARAAYESAALLAPGAQSPLLGLSQLAYASGDGDAAASALERLFALPAGAEGGGDPWWTYAQAPGRFFGPSMTDLIDTLRPEPVQ
jgi:tetratricopeptide (TPR) repeat protein